MFQPRHQDTSLLIFVTSIVSVWLTFGFGDSAGAVRAHVPVTYSKDVAPILFNKCAGCHRPGQTAPMSLLTYKDARPWARSIKEKVLNKSMPPWHADPAYGKFANDRRLSQAEIDTIVAWVDGGAVEGNQKDLPPVPSFGEGWKIGKPDVVLTMPVKFQVPAEGVVNYKYFSVPTNFTQDRWVQAAEVRPGNPAVVHHVIIFVESPSASAKATTDPEARFESLTGVAPGEDPVVLPEGVGMLVRAGSVLVFQVHYTPNGVPQSDQTSVGLIFNKTPVLKAAMGGAAINSDFAIPAGDPGYEVRASYVLEDDCHITSLMPHMHLRGKDFQFRLMLANGDSKILLAVPRYDFNWQTRYELAEPIAAPKGSRIDCIAHFDNSTANKSNPDPRKVVRWGDQTWDEMMIGFVEFTLDHQQLSQDDTRQTSSQPKRESRQPTTANTAPAGLDTSLSVDSILAKYVDALGGKTALQRITSSVMKGTVSVPEFGADGTIVVYRKAPNKELTEIASGLLGDSKTGFDGNSGWDEEDGELKDLPNYPKADADFYVALKLHQLYPRIQIKGEEKAGVREAYVLEAPRRGRPKRWYFDVKTGLLIRTEIRSAEGALLKWEEFSDYRPVDGVQVPFTDRGREENGIEFVVRFSEVKHNVQIDDARFERPGAPTGPTQPDNKPRKSLDAK
jgi:mono/diheme cytochrome c family protein